MHPTTPTTREAPLPFWQRLRAIALYPLRGAALAALVGLTLATLLVGYVPVIGGLLVMLVWLFAYKYAFEILRVTADGYPDAPEVMHSADNGQVLRLVGMYIVFAMLIATATVVAGPGAAAVTLGILSFLQPGIVMSLAIDGSLRHALNPATPIAIVGRIGWPYMAVFGLLFVIQASTLTAGGWLAKHMPGALAQLAVTAVSLWGAFAAFHLMGYLVYQYHDELGYRPERHGLPERHSPDQGLLSEAEAHVRDGRLGVAVELLRTEARTRAVGTDVHELLHRLLRQSGDAAATAAHAGQYVHRLVLENQERRALGVLRDTLAIAPDFVPLQVEDAERLADLARTSGQSQLAVDAGLALLRAHPRHASAARWGLETGLLLAERFGRDDEARTLLLEARGRCDDASLQARIDAVLQALPQPARA